MNTRNDNLVNLVTLALLMALGVFLRWRKTLSEAFFLSANKLSFSILLPVMLALAGGAMLYVVSDEMIPETHAHGYQKLATYALVLGFVSLVFLEISF